MEKDKLQNIVFYLDGILNSASTFIKSQNDNKLYDLNQSKFLRSLKRQLNDKITKKDYIEKRSLSIQMQRSSSPGMTLLKAKKILEGPTTIKKNTLELNTYKNTSELAANKNTLQFQKVKDSKKIKANESGFSMEQWWNVYSSNTGTFYNNNEFSVTPTPKNEFHDLKYSCNNWNQTQKEIHFSTNNSPNWKNTANFNTARDKLFKKGSGQHKGPDKKSVDLDTDLLRHSTNYEKFIPQKGKIKTNVSFN